MSAISNDWLLYLNDEFKKPYYKELYNKYKDTSSNKNVNKKLLNDFINKN